MFLRKAGPFCNGTGPRTTWMRWKARAALFSLPAQQSVSALPLDICARAGSRHKKARLLLRHALAVSVGAGQCCQCGPPWNPLHHVEPPRHCYGTRLLRGIHLRYRHALQRPTSGLTLHSFQMLVRGSVWRCKYQQGTNPAWGNSAWTQVCGWGGLKMNSVLPFFCCTAS